MNEEAIQDAYTLFTEGGYNGNIDDYKQLISTNSEAFSDSYAMFSKGGYTGSDKEFKGLMGIGAEPVEEVEPVKTVDTPKGETAGTENGALDSVSADTTSLLDLKKRLEDKLIQPKSSIAGNAGRFKGIEDVIKQGQEVKRIGDINKKTLNTLEEPVKLEYKNKAVNKLKEEYADAYKDAEGVDYTITDTMIEQEATRLLRVDKDKELYEKTNMWEQTLFKLESSGLSTLSGLAGIPNFANKTLVTLIASDEELSMLNTLTPEQREGVINSFGGGPLNNGLNMLSAETQNTLKAASDKVGESIVQFDQSIGEDFANGNWGRGVFKTFNEGVASIPSLAQAMIPVVGLPSIALGSMSSKQEQLEDEGFGMGTDTTLNSIVSGTAEAVFELVTKKLGNKILGAWKDAPVAGKRDMLKSLYEVALSSGEEGLSEAATSAVQNLSDVLISGMDKDFDAVFKEVVDAFIVGGAMGGVMGATTETITKVKKIRDEIAVNSIIKDESNDYTELSDVFRDGNAKVSKDALSVLNRRSTGVLLDVNLASKVKKGEITAEESVTIKKNYLTDLGALQKTKGIELNNTSRAAAVDLIKEKSRLSEEIKDIDDVLAAPKKARIEKINEDILSLTDKKGTKETLPTMEKFLTEKYGEGFSEEQLTPEEFSKYESLKLEDEGVDTAKEGAPKKGTAPITAPEPVVKPTPKVDNTPERADQDTGQAVEQVVEKRGQVINNTKEETTRIKSLENKSEDGATLNQDGKKYEGKGLVVPIVSKNITQESLTPEAIADFIDEHQDKIGGDNVKVGVYKFPNSNKVSLDLNIVVDPKFGEQALAFAKESGQESLFDLETFENVKTGADGKNPKSFTAEEFKNISEALSKGEAPFSKEGVTNTAEQRSAIMKQVDNARKAIAKLLPNTTIVTYDSEEAYVKATSKGQIRTRGAFGRSSDGNNTIHINLDLASGRTVAHEVFHAVMANKFSEAKIQSVTKLFVGKLSEVLDGDIREELNGFAEMYDAKAPETKSEEFLSELTGMLADNYTQLNPEAKSLIKQWLDKIAGLLGLKGVDTNDVINLLNAIAAKVASGDVINDGDVIVLQKQGSQGSTGTIKIKNQIEGRKSPDPKKDIRSWVRDVVEVVSMKSLEGQSFITNMYDFTTAGVISLGKGLDLELLGGRNYVPYMMNKTGKKLGEVSNLAAFNSKSAAEGFVNSANQSGSSLFAPHIGTMKGSWQFQHHIFDSLVDLVLNKGLISKTNLIKEWNSVLKSEAGKKLLKEFNKKNNSRLTDFNSFVGNPKELVDLLNIENNYSPNLRKALNDKIVGINEIKKRLGVKSKVQILNKLLDPLNEGAESFDIMSVVKFDPTTFEIVKTKPNDADHHPSFNWTVRAKIEKVLQPDKFYKSFEITDSYTKYNSDGTKVSRKTDFKTIKEYSVSNVASSAGAIPKVGKFKSQKAGQITPSNSSNYANLTEDGQGNFVFYHVGKDGYQQIKPSSGANRATSRSEAAALSKVGGMAMYYPDSRREQQVTGSSEYEVKVPMDKVYDFNSDTLGLIDEARELHKKQNPDKAFDSNTQLAYVTKVAETKGFDMVVAEWDGRTRAQTTQALKPTDVRLKDGNTIKKDFKNKYDGNREKGFTSVIPETKEDKLQEAYSNINKERNKAGKYDKLYRLREDSSKYTQGEITELIDNSDISAESKGAYKEALTYKEGKRESVKSSIKSQMTPEQAEAVAKFKKSAAKSRAQATGDNKTYKQRFKSVINGATDQLIDRQGSIKRALNSVGLDRVVDYMVTKSGHSSHAKNRADIVYSKVFKYLSNKMLDNLDEVILLRRIVAIDNNRAERGLKPVKHQDAITGAVAQITLDGYKNDLGDTVFNDLTKRADEYFGEYKQLLGDMRDEGLISEESYELFAEIDYQPRLFLDFLEDMDGNLLLDEVDGSQKVLLSDKQVKAMKTGSEGSQLMDSWYLIQKSLQSRSAAIFSNRVNSAFFNEYIATRDEVAILEKKTSRTKAEDKKVEAFQNLSDQIKVDEVVGYTKSNAPKYKLTDANTKGFKSLYFYENGLQNRILMKEEFHQKFTDTSNSYLSPEVKETFALISGTAVVKTLATGNNPLFFLTNTPRDFAFILAFSEEYSKNVALSTIQLGIDTVKGVKDVVNNTENYQRFLDYGGGMDYLAVQGKFSNKGFAKVMLDNVMDQTTQNKILRNRLTRSLDKFNLASEMGMRLAVFNKSVSNQLKGRDIGKMDKQTRDDIYTKAVRSARELTDFNQGGKTTKAFDAAIPYLNAATQGTRAAVNNLVDRPVETTVRIAQILGYTAASTITATLGAISMFRSEDDEDKDLTNSEIYFKTLETVSNYDLTNYFIMPLGYRDEKGNWKYLRIAKAQALSPTLNITEHFIRKALAKEGGIAYNQNLSKMVIETVENNILPMPLSPFKAAKRVPLFGATTAMMGIDSYTGNPLDWARGDIPEQLEGVTSDKVEPLFKVLGESTGESPVRLQKALESFITTPSTNPYIGIGYAIGNLTAVNRPITDIADDFGKDIFKAATKRLLKSGSDYNKTAKLMEKLSPETIKIYRKHILLTKEVKDKVEEARGFPKAEFNSVINKLTTKYPNDLQRIKALAISQLKKVEMSSYVTNLKYTRNKEVKAIIIAETFGSSLLGKDNLDEREIKLLRELKDNNILDEETIRYYKNMFK